jgi:hypothetical protein
VQEVASKCFATLDQASFTLVYVTYRDFTSKLTFGLEEELSIVHTTYSHKNDHYSG